MKNLILEMSPIGMIQETQNKKTEISGVVGSMAKKQRFFHD